MEEETIKQIANLATLKLKPFRKFIRKLLKVEGKGIVLESDYRKLRALFQGRIMPYLKTEDAKAIAYNIASIGRLVGMGDENSRVGEELRRPVMETVNILMENLGLGGKLDLSIIDELEKTEHEFSPQLFRQAIKENLDNVLVINSDYNLLNRGVYVKKNDGVFLVYTFINDHPYGCEIMIGPFTNSPDAEIFFQLYVPRYVQESFPGLAANGPGTEIRNLIEICVDGREMPLTLSRPLKDSCLMELEQEDCFNDYIPSFSFDDRDSLEPCLRNYAEAAFALGQRAKYIFLNGAVSLEAMYVYEYIARLKKIDPAVLYPSTPWELDEDGDLIVF